MPVNFVAKAVITGVMMASQMALTMSQRFEGQRLDDLKVSVADPGIPIPRFWGLYKFDGCAIIWAEDLKEKKSTNKGKAGKFTDYKYYGTWKVLVAGHPIDAIRRIWFDKQLVFQAKDAGPVSPLLGGAGSIDNGDLGRPVKLRLGRNMSFYLGGEDQMPDPRYEAWCEDRYGPDSAPADRGRATIVFKDIPLEKFGNRIPQITVEAVSLKADAFAYEVKPTADGVQTISFSSDFSRFWSGSEAWDVPTRTRIFERSYAYAVIGRDGTLWQLSGLLGSTLTGYSSDGFAATTPIVHGNYIDDIFCPGNAVCLRPYANAYPQAHYLAGGEIITLDLAFSASMYFEDVDGDIWAVGRPSGGTQIHFYNLSTNATFDIASPAGADGFLSAMDNGQGQFFGYQGGAIFLVDKTSGLLVDSSLSIPGGGDPLRALRYVKPGAASVWFHNREWSTTTLDLLRTITFTDWVVQDVADAIYDPINHALICKPQYAAEFVWRYLDRVGSVGVTLAAISDDVGTLCAMSNFDTSAAADIIVEGWSVTQGTGREMLEPLFTLHDCDLAPHDFGQRIMKRSGVAAGDVIPTEWFVSEGNAKSYEMPRAGDTDLPQRLTVNFRDRDRDLQPNNVTPQRNGGTSNSSRERSIDMTTYVSTAPAMQQLSDRVLRRMWSERSEVRNALTERQLAVEIGDVRSLGLDDVGRTARCSKLTWSNGELKAEWKRDHPSLATLSTGEGGEMDSRDPDEIYIPGPSKAMVLDMPLAADAHDASTPQLYFGAGRYLASGGWPGATLYIADADGDEYAQWNDVASADAMRWGYATDALADAYPWLWDRGNSVNIHLFGGGTLSSVTEAAIDADPTLNLARLGGEWLQFATAVLEGDGSYTLSTFKRGRRGTEGQVGAHAIGDEFVLAADLARDGIGLSEVGTSESFKGATIGRETDGAPVIAMTFAGATLKPYAPCQVRARRDPATGDWTFTWVRRTRLGGAWVGGTTIPLSEASEAYELVIPTSAGSRTIEVTSAAAVWTAAMQTADYGSGQSTLPADIAVYQLSDAVGRGFASGEPLAA